MADKNERPMVYECKNVAENRRVFVYQNGERYFGCLKKTSDGKIISEWDFDAYVCLNDYFLYQTGDSWFCFMPEIATPVYLGRQLEETFYVRENEDGTAHYTYFNLNEDYCLSEGDALQVEESCCLSTRDLLRTERLILVFEQKNFCKIFCLAPWKIWTDPVHVFPFIDESGGYFSVESESENTHYGLFCAQEEKGYYLLHKGKNLSRFHNAFVEEEDDRFVLYVYDGKKLVAAEEGRRFFQNDEGLVLDDKFWSRRDDFPDLLNLTAMSVPETFAVLTGEEHPDENVSESFLETETAKETGLFRRLWQWFGFGK